jgi:hypothetical protein
MLVKSSFLFCVAAVALADPLPQLGTVTSGYGDLTSDLGSFPTSYNPSAASSDLASLSSLESLIAGMPTLPADLESILATAIIPTSAATQSDFGCEILTATPAWFKSLPASAQTELISYESAAASWYSANSAALGTLTTGLPAGGCTNAVVQTTSNSQTSSGSAAASAKSTGAAPHPTGAVTLSFAGIIGALGLMAAL